MASGSMAYWRKDNLPYIGMSRKKLWRNSEIVDTTCPKHFSSHTSVASRRRSILIHCLIIFYRPLSLSKMDKWHYKSSQCVYTYGSGFPTSGLLFSPQQSLQSLNNQAPRTPSHRNTLLLDWSPASYWPWAVGPWWQHTLFPFWLKGNVWSSTIESDHIAIDSTRLEWGQ